MDDPGERRPTKSLLDRTRKRVEALEQFGAAAGPLRKRQDQAEKLFREGRAREARMAADELLIFLKILSGEVDRCIRQFTEEGELPGTGEGDAGLSEQKILDLVHEAFQRSLHSQSFRRMVEVISIEKVQHLLADEYVTRPDFEALRSEMDRGRGKRA